MTRAVRTAGIHEGYCCWVNCQLPDCCGTFAELPTAAVAFRTGMAIDWTPLVVDILVVVFEALLGKELFASFGNKVLFSSICFFFSKSPW